MKKYKDNIISAILATIMSLFIWHNFKVSGNNVIFTLIFIVLLCFFKNNINKLYDKKNKRKNIVVSTISIIFSIVEIVCVSINKDFTLNNVFDKWLLLNFIGYFITAYSIISIIYSRIESYNINNHNIDNKYIKSEKSLIIGCALLIFVAWIPYFIAYYPGIISSDSYSQIQQVLGDIALNNHHPIFHTAIIGIFINIGLMIFNNINIAVALYTLFQMIVLSILYSYVIRFLRKNKVPLYVRILVLLYYMLYPINSTYSVIMWKDILFSGIFPIFTIYCIKLVFNTDEFLHSKKNIILFIIVSLLTIYSRHNGYYVAVITFFVFLIVMRKYWKKLLLIFVSIIVLNIGINYCLYNIIKVNKGSIAEAMSIPLQQIARTIKNNNDIDNETKARVNNFFIEENIWEKYQPTSSDSVKFKLNSKYFEDNKIEFVKLWIKLFIKHPKDYIEATISNSYGYYYIEANNSVLGIYNNIENKYNIKLNPTEDNKSYKTFIKLVEEKNLPVISIMFSIGTAFWVTIILLGYKIYKKKYKYILVYLPILILWLTCVASPVYNELRYAYPLFTTLPIFICLNYMKNKEKLE